MRMMDNVDAAKKDASSLPVVTPYGVDLILDSRVEYPRTPAMTTASKERIGCVTVS
jgi:hypothetical protein